MASRLTFLGHSGVDIRLGSTRVVCDPWLTRRGAYLGTWHQFPDNSHLAAGDLHDTPTLFISSPRPDHFDIDTLRAFPKTPRVVIPALPSRTLADQIRQLGFADVVELTDWQPLDLGAGARLTLVTSSTKHVLGSTLVLEVDGEVVVNQNDCLLDSASLARLAVSKPLVHFVQFSGASYFPAIYDFSPDQMKVHVDEQVKLISRHFFTAATGVGARYVVPSGGPPCVLDEKGFELNFGGSIFFDADELLAKTTIEDHNLVDRLRILYPGDVAGEEGGDWQFGARKPYDDKRSYLEEYRRTREPLRQLYLAELRALAAPVDVKEVRSYLRDFFQFEDMTWDMGILIQFRLSDGPSVWVDFRKKPFRYLTECHEPANYVLTLESAWMSLVLQEKLTWHDLLMGHQVTVHREPDRDCSALMNHFDYRHDPVLFDLVRRLNPALITVEDEQMEYVCQRFCPHRGRDLEYATIERGVLTCTAHGWRFDLRKGGKCLWGGDAPLMVKEIRPRRP
jgi:nitrite reductase/ring-hydroxylating ferredoxin subunit